MILLVHAKRFSISNERLLKQTRIGKSTAMPFQLYTSISVNYNYNLLPSTNLHAYKMTMRLNA